MGLPIGILDSLQLGDQFITVNPRVEASGASVVPVHDADTAELPTGSPNWRKLYEAVFAKNESGSGPTGQWNLHAHFDEVLEAIETGTPTHTLGWIGDRDRVGTEQTGVSAGSNVTLTVLAAEFAALNLAVGDYVFCANGAWGQVNLVGGGPPYTFRIATLSAAVPATTKIYRAWRIYTRLRVLDWDPGQADQQSMDAFRHQERLRMDSQDRPVRSTGA